MIVGVLALQGAFRAHSRKLDALGVEHREVRTVEQLGKVDALVMPGGESTTMSMLLESSGLHDPVAHRLSAGMPVLGTCAGLILLASEVVDGRDDQRCFGLFDMTVQRNGYGRQINSFEAELDIVGLDRPFHAVFIRAPRVLRVGSGIDVLAADSDGDATLLRQGNSIVTGFHPELTNDDRIHRLFVESIAY